MFIFDIAGQILRLFAKNDNTIFGAIGYGGTRKDGGHDHRTNKGPDRTPRQREGDSKRKKTN